MNNTSVIDFSHVEFKGGFWKYRFDLNKTISLKSVYRQFEQTGRFDALRFNYKDRGAFPHVYYDSDVAKWIEAVAYLITYEGGYEDYQKIIDELVLSMEKNQLPDGYLNSHFIQVEPNKIFTDRGAHELYCAGHLIEAAIAYDKATGKKKFLEVMKRYINCIEKAFITEKTAKFTTPGHEEIELALIKLYEYTDEKKYLNMAAFFINNRGPNDQACGREIFYEKEIQSEFPVRELEKAEGHAVRAVYLYTGMAELARKTKDQMLLSACKKLFEDIINKKLYITGGIGSNRRGECFTAPYDLPNLTAYSESCAAIGLILFAQAMQKNEFNVTYSHLIERILYNGLLSSTSMSGKEFFYENPLEIHLDSVNKETSLKENQRAKLPIRERVEVFSCSCCPPNINRIFAKIGDIFFLEKEENLVINQFANLILNNDKIYLEMLTDYPNDGVIRLAITFSKYHKIYIRIPEWCDDYTVSVDHTVIDGYIVIGGNENSVIVDYKMQPYFAECNPNVRANVGRVALLYGPTVYCLERLDNPYPLNSISVDVDQEVTVGEIMDYKMRELTAKGKVDEDFNCLYRKAQGKNKDVTLRFRPYWSFANRGESDMLVWLRKFQ